MVPTILVENQIFNEFALELFFLRFLFFQLQSIKVLVSTFSEKNISQTVEHLTRYNSKNISCREKKYLFKIIENLIL